MRRFLAMLLVLVGVVATTRAEAQEIQLTGPLAGAPAVRSLRLHRAHRLEISPTLTFTLLDEYQRSILIGARINYNLNDWLALGVWGSFGLIQQTTSLSDHIQEVTSQRRLPPAQGGEGASVNNLLTAPSIGTDFKKQLGTVNYVFAPQITVVPFRGKLAIFQKIFVDTDAYFFAGPAFVGLTERANCSTDCATNYNTASRTAVAPTGGLGFSFYTGKWLSFGLEWRALPYKINTGGFDTRGGGQDARFPDQKVDESDRAFKFNQMLTLSFGGYFPQALKTSE